MTYESAESLRGSIELARPTALVAGDFDEDGVPDLVCGYVDSSMQLLTLQRGNVDAIFPNAPEARQRRLEGRFTDQPFLSPARAFPAPVEPHLLVAGDFDNDGHWDVVTTAPGQTSLYLLPGDGRGGLRTAQRVMLPGVVTTLVAGEINRADGPVDLFVGLSGPNGPRVLVFEGPEGAWRSEPEVVSLSAEPTALLPGRLGDGPWYDLAIAAGHELLIVRGRDRRLGFEDRQHAEVPAPVVERIGLPSSVLALTWGDFVREPTPRFELALLLADGSLRFLARDGDPAGWNSIAQRDGIPTWKTTVATASKRAVLIPVRLSGSSTEDLAILDTGTGRLQVVAGLERERNGAVVASLEFEEPPVALLPMRLNGDAWTDLVFLQAGVGAPVTLPSAPLATITVDTSADIAVAGDGSCSLREAILNANSNSDTTSGDCVAGSGGDLIAFQIDGGGAAATIQVDPVLPDVTGSITIDGTTQGCATPPCIALDGSATGENEIGLHLFEGPIAIRGLAIHSFGGSGVVFESTTSGSTFEGNFVGTDLTGTQGMGNGYDGVRFLGGDSNTIGGTTLAARNVISGNTYIGLQIEETTLNDVQGNFVGTDATGTFPIGNGGSAISVGNAADNTIGGTAAGAGNLLSGNGLGVNIWGAASESNEVLGNLIGTDVTGTMALGNRLSGVTSYFASNNTLGGTAAGARNVISASEDNSSGLDLRGTWETVVQGNYIGTDLHGTSALANGRSGIAIFNGGGDNVIGGTAAGAGNVISGNNSRGVDFYYSESGNLVQGNLIGTDATGTVALGNERGGVVIGSSPGNRIGGKGDGARNVISGNGGSGVFVSSSAGTGNSILRNSIFSNGGLGIALGEPTVRINDPGDPDVGPNDYQNFPVVTSVTVDTTTTHVEGLLNSVPSAQFRIELFSNATCDSSAHGEGEAFLGVLDVTTDFSGNASFSGTFPNTVPVGDLITATATDVRGNTSEFSVCGSDSDGDGDTISQVDDCDDDDGQAWMVPGEAIDLILFHTGGTGGTTTLAWTAPSPLGGTLSGVVYDTIRSLAPADFVTSAVCVDTNGGPDPSAIDSTDPAAETVAYFLIRAENGCGTGPLGGSGREARGCP
jgi:CSLREA domain-containing protein